MSELRAPKPPLLKPRFYLHVDFGIDWVQKEATPSSSGHDADHSQASKSRAHGFFSSRTRKNRKPEFLQRRTRSLDEMYPDLSTQPALLDLTATAPPPPTIFPYAVLPLTPGDLNARDPLTGYYAPDESVTSAGLAGGYSEPPTIPLSQERRLHPHYQTTQQHQQQHQRTPCTGNQYRCQAHTRRQHQQRSSSASGSPRHLPSTSQEPSSRIDTVSDFTHPSNLVPGGQPHGALHLPPDPFQELFLSPFFSTSASSSALESASKDGPQSPPHLSKQRPPPRADKKLPEPPLSGHGRNHNHHHHHHHQNHRHLSALISPLSEYMPSPISDRGTDCESNFGSTCSSPVISPLVQSAMPVHSRDNSGSFPANVTSGATGYTPFTPHGQPHLHIRPIRANTYPEDHSITKAAALDEQQQQSPLVPVASNAAEMMALSSAMMTVDSGFEDQRWNWASGP
ncbi:hypothetical protein BROUX41_003640 [Berkeleyomyces rouxiae]|uniref:uncharacterized protein n=1 Tax=Berkeleyomyces rouxiae TaxID=2035830 RepID=UPI003B7DD355